MHKKQNHGLESNITSCLFRGKGALAQLYLPIEVRRFKNIQEGKQII